MAPRRVWTRTDPATSRRMARIRQRDTSAERLVCKGLRRLGLRFGTRNGDLPGSPDIANRARRWAVFVHGCFWHAHRGCAKATVPKRNRSFWLEKFSDNRTRDRRVVRALRARGYRALVIWQCEAENPRKLESHLRRLKPMLGPYTGKR